ncbi:MAG: SDR family oxidoreductase [Candidatus Doudnabacteria bacterium]|nr:SDR family oxidoreductase [Candidatus Doudnabacteria bacterium]
MNDQNQKIFLITGGGGYLGSITTALLLQRGYQVRIIDRFFWGEEILDPLPKENLTLINADTRTYPKEHLKDVYAVFDLAGFSSDAIGELDPHATLAVNYQARVRTATLAKQMGVSKYLLASTCSVYGAQEGIMDETTSPKPMSTYGKAAVMAEQEILPLATADFTPVALRYGSLYGPSRRMRFDLVVNQMVLSIFADKKVVVQGSEKWRPLSHVTDIAQMYLDIAQSDREQIAGEIFNVGNTSHNYQIKNIAQMLQQTLDPKAEILTNNDSDARSFRVSFDKLKNKLGLETTKTPAEGGKEIYDLLTAQKLSPTPETNTLQWYQHLLAKNPKILQQI